MVELKGIVKKYKAGNTVVEALKGVDLTFRDNEFVAVLGPSGCGKTTMLNILGGLDRYTDGDLIINGRSTKDFADRDWDNYRNRRIGFVFQNYNLITHQSVLANVELAMTLSGVSKRERRERAKEALERVGLGDQIKKKPNQMSGGQMQRVAIARALVNNPDILMADEPTGALDSETSVVIMEILKEIAQDRLVIMVTHNGELAEKYATRTVRLLDGEIIGDTNPVSNAEFNLLIRQQDQTPSKKPSMSFFTALSLSLHNLLTKKARTFLTAFAGSIGIIGIALILSLSNGFQAYIDKIQEDTLSTYPLVIQESNADIGSMMSSLAEVRRESSQHTPDSGKIYSLDIMSTMMKTMSTQMGNKNDMYAFNEYVNEHLEELEEYTNAISYNYNVQLNIYMDNTEEITQVNPGYFMMPLLGIAPGDKSGTVSQGGVEYQMGGDMGGMSMMSSGTEVWTEMLDNPELLKTQYDVVAGRWAENYDEVVVVVTENDEIRDFNLYGMGLKDSAELATVVQDVISGKEMESESLEFSYDDILSLTYKVLPNAALYQKQGNIWRDMSKDEAYMSGALNSALTLKVVGIIRPVPGAAATAITGAVGYLPSLTEYMIERTYGSEIVREQVAQPDIDVFSGKPFSSGDGEAEFDLSVVPEEYQALLANMTDEQLAAIKEQYSSSSSATLSGNQVKLGIVDKTKPSSISLYPKDFQSKDKIVEFIDGYNEKVLEDDPEAQPLRYTDFIGILMSSISSVINAISYVLIAFVSISLVVSSIMIGIITYVSVLERTKEIGILKSIGASKGDIARVFNAETIIVGLTAGLIGIGITLILCIPANIIIELLSEVPNVAKLPVAGGVLLIVLSMLLTLIAGLIPSKVAANKDPVVALRTE